MQRSRLNPVSPKKRKRSGKVGKCGIVRLYGEGLLALKHECQERDKYACLECGEPVACFCSPSGGAHRVCYRWFHGEDISVKRAEMAHIRTKRNNGDTLDNVRTLCPDCHRKEHNAGGKPCPKK